MARFAEDWSRFRRSAQQVPLLTLERERSLLRAARQGDKAALQELVASHMRLVVDIAARHGCAALSAHDLVGEGVVGLLEAVTRFDLSRETRFSSYAIWWVRACVVRYALANRSIVGMPCTRGARIAQSRMRGVERDLGQQLGRVPTRDEVADTLGVKKQEVEAVERALSVWDLSLSQSEAREALDEGPGPELLVAEAEDKNELRLCLDRVLGELNPRERQVLCEREDGKSLSEMARELGISRQRAGQILAGVRDKLRVGMDQRVGCSPLPVPSSRRLHETSYVIQREQSPPGEGSARPRR